jgi:hypothetical protein
MASPLAAVLGIDLNPPYDEASQLVIASRV